MDEQATITYDDFAKLDLRVAKVLEVSEHPNADKLLVLKIDLGDHQRQILAGVKQHYTPEELVGKNIIVIANLQPRDIRGMTSNGMLLAAGDGDRVIVLTTEKADAAPGSKVS